MNQYYTTVNIRTFAQSYNCNAYGAGNFGESTCASNAGGGASGGQLTNTGIAIIAVVTIACVLLLAAVIIRFWKRPSKKSATQVTAATGSTSDTSKSQ